MFHSITEGATEYTTCDGLLTASSSTWPETALFQIAASGVSLDKLVIGKPGTTSDASNGYMDESTLASCVAEAAGQGWSKSPTPLTNRAQNSHVTRRCRRDGVAGAFPAFLPVSGPGINLDGCSTLMWGRRGLRPSEGVRGPYRVPRRRVPRLRLPPRPRQRRLRPLQRQGTVLVSLRG